MRDSIDVVEKLREMGSELIDIGVAVNEPYELVARIGAISFMCNWIADQLDRQLEIAVERGKVLKSRNYCWTCDDYGHAAEDH